MVRFAPQIYAQQDGQGGVVVLNAGTGQWHVLNATAAAFWKCWWEGVDFEQSLGVVAPRFPQTNMDRLRADAGQLLEDLRRRGIVADGGRPSRQRSARVRAVRRLTLGRPAVGALAPVGLALSVVLLRFPFRAVCAIVRASRRLPLAAVTEEQARVFRAAARGVCGWFPGRAACLEISLTAVLLAVLLGRRLDWCLGAVPDPYRFHAWVEVEGLPVAEPVDPAIPGPVRVMIL